MIKAELSKFGLKKVILKTPTKLISQGLHKNRYETVKKILVEGCRSLIFLSYIRMKSCSGECVHKGRKEGTFVRALRKISQTTGVS